MDIVPDGGAMLGYHTQWLPAQCLDIAADGWWWDASILRPIAEQCFNFAPDGSATLQYCACWRHNVLILHLMAVQCLDVALDGWWHDASILHPILV